MKNPASKICHIVGGGPSLAGFDWQSLNGEFVIAINDAYKVLPLAPVVMFSVAAWVEKNLRGVVEHSGIKLGCSTVPSYFPGVLDLTVTNAAGLEMRRGKVAGLTTGQMALNFAAQIGFREIWLYGFDMHAAGPRSHWHDDAVFRSTPLEYVEFARAIDRLEPELTRIGARVWNLSPDSALRAFPKIKVRPLTKPDLWSEELTSSFRPTLPAPTPTHFRQG